MLVSKINLWVNINFMDILLPSVNPLFLETVSFIRYVTIKYTGCSKIRGTTTAVRY
jgi:hypothetical protein